MRMIALFALLALQCYGQTSTLRVFSEFIRIDPFGKIVPQDRGSNPPRDILSPGVPRNGFSSLRIALTFDKPAKYILDIGQNPENAVKVTLYRERIEKHGDQWIPDALEQVKVPYEGVFTGLEVPGQTTVTFWLDMWVNRGATVDRIKVEPQLWVSYSPDWFTYPMEVRILETTIPQVRPAAGSLPAVADRSDAAVLGPLRAAVCRKPEAPGQPANNARALIRRNVLQHLAIADPAKTAKLLKAAGAASIESWCASEVKPAAGPEWYLRFRDSLFRHEFR